LNDKEILGQALIFMIAGYETTSVLMSFFFYVMATEPVIQEKVYDEIRQELGDVCCLSKFVMIVTQCLHLG
jgi:cytochrome P450